MTIDPPKLYVFSLYCESAVSGVPFVDGDDADADLMSYVNQFWPAELGNRDDFDDNEAFDHYFDFIHGEAADISPKTLQGSPDKLCAFALDLLASQLPLLAGGHEKAAVLKRLATLAASSEGG